jgi:peptidylprolyl isomerase
MKILKNIVLKLALFVGLAFFVHQLSAQCPFNEQGFKKTSSGLRYKIVREGTGMAPRSGNRVWVHYEGYLANDSLFSSSLASGQGPLETYLGQGKLIKAWEEGLVLLKAGGIMEMIVPPGLGYGAEGSKLVPPNAWLRFEIALTQVDKIDQIVPYETQGKKWQLLDKGVKIIEIEPGTGEKPKYDYLVYLDYSGFLPDSSIFSTSLTKTNPLKLRMGNPNMMKGWGIALKHVQKGGKYKLFFPYKVAYGRRGVKNLVPSKTDVVMDIVVHEVKAPPVIKPWETTGDTIITLSGLSYVVVNPGDGDLIQKNNAVTVHYSGFFTNGELFDSSIKYDEPIKFPVGKGAVIQGWDEGLQLMRKGAKFKLFIPYHLGYGDQGSPPEIPPYSNLVFDVEVLEVNPN